MGRKRTKLDELFFCVVLFSVSGICCFVLRDGDVNRRIQHHASLSLEASLNAEELAANEDAMRKIVSEMKDPTSERAIRENESFELFLKNLAVDQEIKKNIRENRLRKINSNF